MKQATGLSTGTTLLFGLPGVRVQRVEQDEFDPRVVHLATAEHGSASGCPGCGVVSTSVKGLVTTAPRDIPYGETGISVRSHKKRWRCREATCARLSINEAIEEIPAGWRTTGRLRRAIGAAVGDAARSDAEVAGAHGVSWPTAHAAFVEHPDALLTAPNAPAADSATSTTSTAECNSTALGPTEQQQWLQDHFPQV